MSLSFPVRPRNSTFDPTYKTVADSWKRASKAERKDHFFAQLDFTDGQAIFAKVSRDEALFSGALDTGT